MADRGLGTVGVAALVVLGPAPVPIVVAADYLTVEGAQRELFSQADHFDAVVLAVSADQQRRIAELAGSQPPHRSLRAWKALRGDELLGHVFVDEVLGREDMITYAVGIDRAGRLTELEVLSYRESHGGEIRTNAWRHQFAGREGLQGLRLGVDIKNIAGATLSCEHVTQGVRWVMSLWQVALRTAERPAA